MFDSFTLSDFFNYLGQFLQYLFAWSNIVLSMMFFLLANHLINASQKFELKQDNLKLRIKKIDVKCRYGVFVLGTLSVLSLFRIFQLILLLCFYYFPFSLFLFIIHTILKVPVPSSNTGLVLLTIATISFLSFILSILGLYSFIFRKLIYGTKTKGLLYFIGFFALAFFLDFP